MLYFRAPALHGESDGIQHALCGSGEGFSRLRCTFSALPVPLLLFVFLELPLLSHVSGPPPMFNSDNSSNRCSAIVRKSENKPRERSAQ